MPPVPQPCRQSAFNGKFSPVKGRTVNNLPSKAGVLANPVKGARLFYTFHIRMAERYAPSRDFRGIKYGQRTGRNLFHVPLTGLVYSGATALPITGNRLKNKSGLRYRQIHCTAVHRVSKPLVYKTAGLRPTTRHSSKEPIGRCRKFFVTAV